MHVSSQETTGSATFGLPRGGRLSLIVGDITRESCDAIVNAANSSLLGGGGVDGAVHRAGGPEILEQCKAIVQKIGHLPAGQAVITTAGKMPSKHVIHTVGPVWYGGDRNESETLASCYRNSLRVADENGLTSIAFPSISTGAFGYPTHAAANVAVSAILNEAPKLKHVTEIRFVLFDNRTYNQYLDAAHEVFSRSGKT